MQIQQEKASHQGERAEEFSLLFRKPAGDALWSIDRSPLRRNAPRSVVVDLGCSGGVCCVMAGSLILMADGSTKAIETFVGGEQIHTLMGVATVENLEVTTLGVTRKLLEIDSGDGDPLYITGEHSLWSRNEQGEQWWGTYDFHHYWFETQVGTGSVLKKPPMMLRWDLANEHAHIDGWKKAQPVFCQMPHDTPLYHLNVSSGGSYIANGFVIISHCHDELVAGANWQGLTLPKRELPEFKLPATV